jgi:hypothetical protein
MDLALDELPDNQQQRYKALLTASESAPLQEINAIADELQVLLLMRCIVLMSFLHLCWPFLVCGRHHDSADGLSHLSNVLSSSFTGFKLSGWHNMSHAAQQQWLLFLINSAQHQHHNNEIVDAACRQQQSNEIGASMILLVISFTNNVCVLLQSEICVLQSATCACVCVFAAGSDIEPGAAPSSADSHPGNIPSRIYTHSQASNAARALDVNSSINSPVRVTIWRRAARAADNNQQQQPTGCGRPAKAAMHSDSLVLYLQPISYGPV